MSVDICIRRLFHITNGTFYFTVTEKIYMNQVNGISDLVVSCDAISQIVIYTSRPRIYVLFIQQSVCTE